MTRSRTHRGTHRAALLAAMLAALMLAAAVGCDGGQADATAAESTSGYRGAVDTFDLEAYRGRVVLLNFWATWCTPCLVEIPDLVRLRRDFEGEEVSIVGISLDARGSREQIEAQLRQFIERHGMTYPIYLDSEQQLAGRFSGGYMAAVPTTILLDREGKVRRLHSGLPMGRNGRPDVYGTLAREVQALLDEG